MAESQADSAIIARAFGGIVLKCAITQGPASYDDLGQRFVFVRGASIGDERFALDIERRGHAPISLSKKLNMCGATFFQYWTELEVVAKLRDESVLALLRQKNLPLDGICLTRVDTSDYWIAVGKWVKRSSCNSGKSTK